MAAPINFKAVLTEKSTDWADDVENEEKAKGAPLTNQSEFPSLEAARAPVQKKAKAKVTKLSLGDFHTKVAPGSKPFLDRSLDDKAILMQLPTSSLGGPRAEGGPGMGGGFKEYGGDRGGREGREGECSPVCSSGLLPQTRC
jgi:hypothetical protein